MTLNAVLVVEDNLDIREATVALLREEGHLVFEAENGHEALRVLSDLPEPPCLILLDLMMPVMDGWAFMQNLRETDRLATLPVVVVSAVNGAPAGARRFIKKPVPAEVLLQLVEEFCQSS